MEKRGHSKHIILLIIICLSLTAYFVFADVDLVSPSNGVWTNSNDTLAFVFNVSNATILNNTVHCNLTINGTVMRNTTVIVNDSEITTFYANNTFLEGLNYWNVTCSNGTVENISATRTFIADYTIPLVFDQSVNVSVLKGTEGILVRVNASDANLNTSDVYVNNVSMSQSLGAMFEVNQTPLGMGCAADGTCVLTFNVTDNATNRNQTTSLSILVDSTAPTLFGATNNVSFLHGTDGILIRVNVSDVTRNSSNVFVNNVSMSASLGDMFEVNTTPAAIGCSTDGACSLTFNATDNATNVNSTVMASITVDDTAPFLSTAVGILNDADKFYIVGDLLNVSINFTDVTINVSYVTFNFSSMCPLTGYINATLSSGLWVSNCSVTVSDDFQAHNITFEACDYVGNCNVSQFYTVVLYNFTFPSDVAGVQEFDHTLTTNLSAESDLNTVNYVLGMRLNGTVLPGQPWSNFRLTALLNFSSINFTDPVAGSSLANLNSAINITIRDPRSGSYGGSRIYINTSAFAALDTSTNITLYGLPFADVDATDILNDSGSSGGISNVVWVSDGDGIGNLSFQVDGFSGYNVSDSVAPTISVFEPANHSFNTSFVFNATFNGTGTEIDNRSINLTLVRNGAAGSYYFNFTNMSCVTSNNRELLHCNITPSIVDGNYNFTITVKDFGGVSGNSNSYDGVNVTIDTTVPSVFAPSANVTLLRSTDPILIRVNVSDTNVDDNNVSVNNVSMFASAGNMFEVNTTPAGMGCSGSGACNLTFNATDNVGLSNGTTYTTITVDDVVPVVSGLVAVYPSGQTAVKNGDAVAINATVIDSIAGVNTVLANTTGLGCGVTVLTQFGSTNTYNGSCTLSGATEGALSVLINATDNVSNVNNTESLTVLVDNTNPSVFDPTATPSLLKSSGSVTVTVNVTDATLDPSNVSVNGVSMAYSAGDMYSVATTGTALGCTSDGSCTLTFNNTDNASNSNGTTTTSITIDNTNPLVFGASVNTSTLKNSDPILVRVNATDTYLNTSNVYVNNVSMFASAGNMFEVNTTPAGMGCSVDSACTLTFNATDNASNVNATTTTSITSDDSGPNISSVAASTASSSATITWTTSESANSSVIYSTNVSNMNFTAGSASLATSQSVSLASLASSTLYYYNVSSCDAQGNCNSSGPYNFTTLTVGGAGSGNSGGGSGVGTTYDGGLLETNGPVVGSWDRLKRGDRIKLMFKGVTHYIKVTRVGFNWASFEVSSDPQAVKLPVGNSMKVDVDLDGEDDLTLTLDAVYGSKASFTIESLLEPATPVPVLDFPPPKRVKPVVEPVVEEAPVVEEPVEVQPAPVVSEEQVAPKEETRAKWGPTIYVSIVLALVLLAMLYLGFVVKRRRNF